MSNDLKGRLRRFGHALIGKEQESVIAVRQAASGFVDFIGLGLKATYNETVREPVPQEFTDLLASLPSSAGRRANGRH